MLSVSSADDEADIESANYHDFDTQHRYVANPATDTQPGTGTPLSSL